MAPSGVEKVAEITRVSVEQVLSVEMGDGLFQNNADNLFYLTYVSL